MKWIIVMVNIIILHLNYVFNMIVLYNILFFIVLLSVETFATMLDITPSIRDLFIITLSYAISDKFKQLEKRLFRVKKKEVRSN